MWAYFGAVWVLVLAAFLLGVLLAWLFWVRPLRKLVDERARTRQAAVPAESAVPRARAGSVDGTGYEPAYSDDAGLAILADRGADEAQGEPVGAPEYPWDWAFTEGGWERTNPEPGPGETSAEAPFGSESALPAEDGSAPSAEFTVKARTSSMVFHTRESPFYENLVPQVWFTDPEAAVHAGFTDWERPNDWDAERTEEG
jgi:hypothetical protein